MILVNYDPQKNVRLSIDKYKIQWIKINFLETKYKIENSDLDIKRGSAYYIL